MSAFDEKENEILPSLDVGKRKRSSILKSVGNAVPINKKKKLSFSTIQYQELFADGTSRIFYQSINDISASESLVEPSKIFPNDDMDEDSSGDDLLNKTKYFSNEDISIGSSIGSNSERDQTIRDHQIENSFEKSKSENCPVPDSSLCADAESVPQAENDRENCPDPEEVTVMVENKSIPSDQNDSMVSISKSESTQVQSDGNTISNEADQPSLEISSAKFSLDQSSSSYAEEPQAIPESEMQPGPQFQDLTLIVATGPDETQTSLCTQHSPSRGSERLSSSDVTRKSFAVSDNETCSVPDRSICQGAATNSTSLVENVDKKWPDFGEVTVMVDNKSLAPHEGDSIDSLSKSETTLEESSHSTVATEVDQPSLEISNIEYSLRRSSSSFVETPNDVAESEVQPNIQLPDLTNFVATGQDDTQMSIGTQCSSTDVSERLSLSNVVENSFAISENETFSTPDRSMCPAATNSTSPAENIDKKWPDFGEVTVVVDNKSVAPDQEDSMVSTAESESTMKESEDNTIATEADQPSLEISNIEYSLRRSGSSFVETPNDVAESEVQPNIQLPDLTHFVATGQDDVQISISTQYSSTDVSERLSLSNVVENSFAISENESFSTPDRSICPATNSTPRADNLGKKWPDFGEVTVVVDNKSIAPELENSMTSTAGSESTLKESDNTLTMEADQPSLEISNIEFSRRRSPSPSVNSSHAAPESEAQPNIQLPDLTHFVTTGPIDTQMSIGTQRSSSRNSERISSSNVMENSLATPEIETCSVPDNSLCAATESISLAENEPHKCPDLEVVEKVDNNNKSVIPEESEIIAKSESTLKEFSEDTATTKADQPSLEISNIEFSLHRSSSPFVEISHAAPEIEMHPSHHFLEVTHSVVNNQDKTFLTNVFNSQFDRSHTLMSAHTNKPSIVLYYFDRGVSVNIKYRCMAAIRDKIQELSWSLNFKNGVPFVAQSDSGEEIIVEPENRKMLIIIEKFINVELSKLEKSLDSIYTHGELVQKLERIFRRIANLATELIDLWQRCDGKLISKSEDSFGCGFYIEGLRDRMMVLIDLNLQQYPDEKVSVRLRVPSSDRLLYTTISPKMLDNCRAVNPSVNKLNYLRRVVKSAEDFISDYKKQGEIQTRCACSHSEKLCAIISAPVPDIDRATLVEKVADVLTSSWDDVPLYKRDPNFRRKIRHSLHRNVNKAWKAIQLKYS